LILAGGMIALFLNYFLRYDHQTIGKYLSEQLNHSQIGYSLHGRIKISLNYILLQLISAKDMPIHAPGMVLVEMITRLMDIHVFVLRDLLAPGAKKRVRKNQIFNSISVCFGELSSIACLK